VVLHGIGEILDAVSEGHADLAAAGLTKTASRTATFLTGPEYQQIEEQVVCHPRARVRHIDDLVGKRIRIIADSSYEERLRALKATYADLRWETSEEESTEQLLELVSQRHLDCTVADSNIVALDRRVLPELRTPFSLGEAEYLAWFVSDSAEDLMGPLETWFGRMRDSGRLQALLDRYYWHARDFDYYDIAVFQRRVERRLPAYAAMFEQAESAAGLDWRLLAALAYQESHWDPEAVSLKGARGLMMLTEETAAELGVDPTDPRASILGGAYYLKDLIARIPAYVPEPDRTFMALAAYNVGYAHLEDARKLAIDLGEDPNRWAGVRNVLPLLSQPRYFQQLRHGYARGGEPVLFVESVRTYYGMLTESFSRVRADELPSTVVASTNLLQSLRLPD
jgi:membrane-bound lytic murein transglycosylase F